MKKIFYFVITEYILPESVTEIRLLVSLFLDFAGKLLCKDFVFYFDKNEARTLLMKKIYKAGCKMCGDK